MKLVKRICLIILLISMMIFMFASLASCGLTVMSCIAGEPQYITYAIYEPIPVIYDTV